LVIWLIAIARFALALALRADRIAISSGTNRSFLISIIYVRDLPALRGSVVFAIVLYVRLFGLILYCGENEWSQDGD
jgi:hypothetical protein